MKLHKSKTLLLTLALLASISSAHAQSFGSILTGITDKATTLAKEAAEAAKKKTTTVVSEVNKTQVVTDSILRLSGTLSSDVQWLMVKVTKENFDGTYLYPVSQGEYNARVSLQAGSGVYTIALYVNKSSVKYTSYTSHKKFSVDNTDSRDMSFLLPTEKVQSDNETIIALTKSITQDAQNDEEAFAAIYQHVTSMIKYDYPNYNNGNYVNVDYNALYTLESGIAVCEGYSNLIAAMARAYGIRAKVIFGKALVGQGRMGAHGWNEVFINDEWKVVDSTWDAGRKNQKYYFMDQAVFAQDHFKEKEMDY